MAGRKRNSQAVGLGQGREGGEGTRRLYLSLAARIDIGIFVRPQVRRYQGHQSTHPSITSSSSGSWTYSVLCNLFSLFISIPASDSHPSLPQTNKTSLPPTRQILKQASSKGHPPRTNPIALTTASPNSPSLPLPPSPFLQPLYLNLHTAHAANPPQPLLTKPAPDPTNPILHPCGQSKRSR